MGRAWGPPEPTMSIISDASKAGWGAALRQGRDVIFYQGSWDPVLQEEQINALELRAVLNALVAGGEGVFARKFVRLFSDNAATVAICNKQFSRSGELRGIIA